MNEVTARERAVELEEEEEEEEEEGGGGGKYSVCLR